MIIIEIIRRAILSLLRVYEILFILRAIMSWFPMMQAGGFTQMLYTLTEPVIAPIRALLHKIPALASFPIDFSVLVAFLLIDVLRTLILIII